MIDVSKKSPTLRIAVAESTIRISPATVERILARSVPKGDPLEVARVAGIMAAKRTQDIIPFCHPVPIEFIGIEHKIVESRVTLTATVKGIYRTGMEMEAMTAAAVAALTVYDMLKMLDDEMEIESVKLIEKRGGKSDFKTKVATPLHAAVLVLSDSVSAGKKSDASGLLIKDVLTNSGIIVDSYEILPDDRVAIIDKLRDYCDKSRLDLVVTTGGTGFSPRDTTPEAMLEVIERSIPGIPEAMRAYGQQRTPYAMLSRSSAGIRGNTLILNLPGSKRGVQESLDALFPALLHAFPMMRSGGHENPKLKNSDD
ncbi:MAG: bifunctional molybdenum cofactor biosynthesis protein MoaC/MoaB [Calditrichaeota bacterium]|nr:bifunctional molybdenum cofactor biosynthesis protein MoaC/MoaB [Calditrichota bacterium]